MRTKWLTIALLAGWAAPARGLVVTPARTEVNLIPGATTSLELTATNDDKVEVQVDVSKKDWFVPAANKAWTVGRWLDVRGPARFDLKPGESRKVRGDVACPKDMAGEVVAMVSFTYRTEQQSMVTPMISVSVYLMAAGTEIRSGEVVDIMVRRNQDQLGLSAMVKSTGNVHLRPRGRLVALDAKGGEVAVVPVPMGQPTYPGMAVLYSGSAPFPPKLAPGTYVAKAELYYQDVQLEKTKEFTVLPDGQVQMSPIK